MEYESFAVYEVVAIRSYLLPLQEVGVGIYRFPRMLVAKFMRVHIVPRLGFRQTKCEFSEIEFVWASRSWFDCVVALSGLSPLYDPFALVRLEVSFNVPFVASI